MILLDRRLLGAESGHLVRLERWCSLVPDHLLSLLAEHTKIVVLLVHVGVTNVVNLWSIRHDFIELVPGDHLGLGRILEMLIVSRVISSKT